LLDEIGERDAQFLGGAKEAGFGGLFAGADDLADLFESHAVEVAEFEDQAFAWGQLVESMPDAVGDHAVEKEALGIGFGAGLNGEVQGLAGAVVRGGAEGSLAAGFAFAQIVEADVGGDAVKPGLEVGVGAKRVEVAVGAQEGFLVDLLSLFDGAEHVPGQAKDTTVAGAHQPLEGVRVAALRCADPVRQGTADAGSLRGRTGLGFRRHPLCMDEARGRR